MVKSRHLPAAISKHHALSRWSQEATATKLAAKLPAGYRPATASLSYIAKVSKHRADILDEERSYRSLNSMKSQVMPAADSS